MKLLAIITLSLALLYLSLIAANSRSWCDVAAYGHRQSAVFICERQAMWGRVP